MVSCFLQDKMCMPEKLRLRSFASPIGIGRAIGRGLCLSGLMVRIWFLVLKNLKKKKKKTFERILHLPTTQPSDNGKSKSFTLTQK